MKGSPVYKQVLASIRYEKETFDSMFPLVSEQFPSILANVTFQEWKWAKDIGAALVAIGVRLSMAIVAVQTRTFWVMHKGVRDLALIPFADLPNHNDVPVSWENIDHNSIKLVCLVVRRQTVTLRLRCR